jgi:hypothetical protein
MNTTDVTTAASRMLQNESNTRWDASTMLAYAVLAEQRAFELRPDLWVSAGGAIAALGAGSGTIVPSICEALAHYVAFLALSEDDADRGNAQNAADHLGLFIKMLQGG